MGDPRVPLLSATGSTAMGRKVAAKVHARLGRTLLELGGNNAVIVAPSANLELALRAMKAKSRFRHRIIGTGPVGSNSVRPR